MIFSKCISDDVIPLPTLYLKFLLASLGPVPTWFSTWYGFCPLCHISLSSPLYTLLQATEFFPVPQNVPVVTLTPTHHFLRETFSECPEFPQFPSLPTMSSYNIVHLYLIAFITVLKYTVIGVII